eukprot:scaffold33364_cov146-Isochrysis_galbana.AAC.2
MPCRSNLSRADLSPPPAQPQAEGGTLPAPTAGGQGSRGLSRLGRPSLRSKTIARQLRALASL